MARRNKGAERAAAIDRVHRLVDLAGQKLSQNAQLSTRYVRLARRIAMRYQVSLPREVRRRLCRTCDLLLVPGRTARVRSARARIAVSCLRCGTVKRYPYRPSRK